MSNIIEQIVSDEGLIDGYKGTDFDDTDYRNLTRKALLKVACNYTNGSTMKFVLRKLKLIKKNKYELTNKGKEYLYFSFDKCK